MGHAMRLLDVIINPFYAHFQRYPGMAVPVGVGDGASWACPEVAILYTTHSPSIPWPMFGLDALRLAETVVGAGAPLLDHPGPAATSVHQHPVCRGSLVDVVAAAATVHGLVHRPAAASIRTVTCALSVATWDMRHGLLVPLGCQGRLGLHRD